MHMRAMKPARVNTGRKAFAWGWAVSVAGICPKTQPHHGKEVRSVVNELKDELIAAKRNVVVQDETHIQRRAVRSGENASPPIAALIRHMPPACVDVIVQ